MTYVEVEDEDVAAPTVLSPQHVTTPPHTLGSLDAVRAQACFSPTANAVESADASDVSADIMDAAKLHVAVTPLMLYTMSKIKLGQLMARVSAGMTAVTLPLLSIEKGAVVMLVQVGGNSKFWNVMLEATSLAVE